MDLAMVILTMLHMVLQIVKTILDCFKSWTDVSKNKKKQNEKKKNS